MSHQVAVRQLQQELADTLKKQSMSEASLEVSSRYRSSLEEEARDLKKNLSQLRSQVRMNLVCPLLRMTKAGHLPLGFRVICHYLYNELIS